MSYEDVWNEIVKRQGQAFYTYSGLEFTYEIKGNCIYTSRKAKEINPSSLRLAYDEALKLGLKVKGPKKLKSYGACYIYPVFLEIGFIEKT